MKPTELEPNHVIYVGDSGKVLYDSDYHSVVKFTINNIGEIGLWGTKPCIIEKLKDGTLTVHYITGATVGDTIELSPASYGFGLSSWDYRFNYYYTGNDSRLTYPHASVDISEYDSSEVTDFSYMFAACDSISGIENLDTSKGTNFNYMFKNAFDTNRTSELIIKIPLDLTNISVDDTSDSLNCVSMFEGLVYPTSNEKQNTGSVKGVRLDLSEAKCPHFEFLYGDDERYKVIINDKQYTIDIFKDGPSAGMPFNIVVDYNNENLKRLLYAGIKNVDYNKSQTGYKLFSNGDFKEITDVNMD